MRTKTTASSPPSSHLKPMKPLGGASVFYYGESMVWITGSALALCVMMIVGLVGFIIWRGLITFWPLDIHEYQLKTQQRIAGEVHVVESYDISQRTFDGMSKDVQGFLSVQLASGQSERTMLRSCNFDITGTHFTWFDRNLIEQEKAPEWMCFVERMTKKPFVGYPQAFVIDGTAVQTGAAATWTALQQHLPAIHDRHEQRVDLEKHALGEIRHAEMGGRMHMIAVRLSDGETSAAYQEAQQDYKDIQDSALIASQVVMKDINVLKSENQRYMMRMRTASGTVIDIPGDEIVRIYAPNRMGVFGKLSVYLSRWWEFLTADPRQANSQGGIWPALFGTVVMTLLMTILVVPFGVVTALYMREYAKKGWMLNATRIAINNLAGVPSIVFGIFGLGFFCYILGDYVDDIFYPAYASEAMPVFKKGGILWAASTLALLTLPVVIVATEEALSAVPNSMREGSYGCGASKWQTIRRIVLPRAMPGIMTGMILAMARGAGEVAPLMLVGAVKVAAELPTDPSASFMHLGFHIYDLSYHSQDSEAAMPMAFTTTLVLITIVAVLNIVAIRLRNRLNKRFHIQSF